MSLVPDYENSSESSESNDDEIIEENSLPERSHDQSEEQVKLPKPDFLVGESKGQSIFTNPFVEAEIAKTALLEKHVKMVNKTDNAEMINGKKICWNYRKGKCRFGHNCKFAHDTELQRSKDQLVPKNCTRQAILKQNKQLAQTSTTEGEEENDVKTVKRKRPGLTQGLVPGKKVMKNYFNNK